MSRDLNYNTALDCIYSLADLGIRPGLYRILSVLRSLNNPHKFYPSVLIAGTNGKGSTAEIVYSILKNAGYKTGIYTSPHLYRFEERIRINGSSIPRDKVAELSQTILAHLEDKGEYLTFFEFVTVMAFLYFADQKIDIAVLEVGMGGRLDAVNVVDPLVSIITDIDYDHTYWLGDTIQKIAYEKAGIIKENSTVVSSCLNTEAVKVLMQVGKDKKSENLFINRDFRVDIGPDKKNFDFYDCQDRINNITLPLSGDHFILNASGAIESTLQLKNRGFNINEDNIHQGLEYVRLPCRMELVATGPNIIIDVAHNPQAVKALINSINEHFQYKRLFIVLGMMRDKMISSILDILSFSAYRIILTMPDSPRAAEPEIVKRENRCIRNQSIVIDNVANAVKESIALAYREDLICVTGSFYTAVEARRILVDENSGQTACI